MEVEWIPFAPSEDPYPLRSRIKQFRISIVLNTSITPDLPRTRYPRSDRSQNGFKFDSVAVIQPLFPPRIRGVAYLRFLCYPMNVRTSDRSKQSRAGNLCTLKASSPTSGTSWHATHPSGTDSPSNRSRHTVPSSTRTSRIGKRESYCGNTTWRQSGSDIGGLLIIWFKLCQEFGRRMRGIIRWQFPRKH